MGLILDSLLACFIEPSEFYNLDICLGMKCGNGITYPLYEITALFDQALRDVMAYLLKVGMQLGYGALISNTISTILSVLNYFK